MNPQKVKSHRPQEPMRPFPYREQEVRYVNEHAQITLSGTITLPQAGGPFPAVLLISGMGPNDRDYTTCGHKLFLVLADYLTRQGIAVLRVDKRGVGKSTGTFDTTVTSKDFAEDVRAGVAYLKTHPDINAKQIGLIGHSEGGMIASMVAANNSDIAFMISMAGAFATHSENAAEQTASQLRADGASQALIDQDRTLHTQILAIVTHEQNSSVAEQRMRELFATYWKQLPEDLKSEAEKFHFALSNTNAEEVLHMFNSPWYRFLLAYKPLESLKDVTAPVLAINGSLDWISSSKTLSGIATTLEKAGNSSYTTTEFLGLNHHFQSCKTGALHEYEQLEQTLAPNVLQLIAHWISEHTSTKLDNIK
jgi:uncharacterized protein